MDSQRKVSHVFYNNLQGSRLRGQPKKHGGTVYLQIIINAKLQIGYRGQKTELTGRSPLRRQRSAMDCRGVGGEEEEKGLLLLQSFA